MGGLANYSTHVCKLQLQVVLCFVCGLGPVQRRLWQGSPYSSNATELQTLKNTMHCNTARMRSEQREDLKAGVCFEIACLLVASCLYTSTRLARQGWKSSWTETAAM